MLHRVKQKCGYHNNYWTAYGFADENNNIVISCDYDDVDTKFYEGLTRVKNKGKVGFINEKGKIVIPLIYNDAWHFSEELAPVKQNSKWGFIDKKGNIIIPFIYDYAGVFSNGLTRVKRNSKWGFIDKKGNIIIPFIYDYAYDFSKVKTKVEIYKETVYINKFGEFLKKHHHQLIEAVFKNLYI